MNNLSRSANYSVFGRFLGVDPVIQNPYNSQNYNGYIYCLNNPLSYSDPSGYETKAYNSIKISPEYFDAFLKALAEGKSLSEALNGVHSVSDTVYYDDETDVLSFWIYWHGESGGPTTLTTPNGYFLSQDEEVYSKLFITKLSNNEFKKIKYPVSYKNKSTIEKDGLDNVSFINVFRLPTTIPNLYYTTTKISGTGPIQTLIVNGELKGKVKLSDIMIGRTTISQTSSNDQITTTISFNPLLYFEYSISTDIVKIGTGIIKDNVKAGY